ncbi:GNAT family N-acetyltransferase [Aeromicrobium sp. CTD01-1L150]|uniref:GNAT family N-acetyltransferase n=1 Tax=Aeromicrobium sp. CTD01-1L150 TaxID=3341830 RepID=UPI0035BFE87A
MTRDLVVREATDTDLSRILELTRQDSMHYFDEPETVTAGQRAAFAEITADPNQDLLVGEVDGRVVATCQLTWMRMLAADGGLYCQVEAVRTEASLRGRGIGAALMAHVEAEARRRGVARMQLTSNSERADAHRFYQRLGYLASHVGMKKYL